MGKLFTLDEATRAVITDALDDLITELGKDCLLVYPPRWVACNNCGPSLVGGGSNNHWKTGGPLPFPNGTTCPVCQGTHKRAEQVQETVRMLCQWLPEDYQQRFLPIQVRVPSGRLQTKAYLRDLPKIKLCDHLIFQAAAQPYGRWKYRLASDPQDASNVIQGRYCVAYWERTE